MIVFFFIFFAVLRFCDLRGGGSSSRHHRLLLTAPHGGCALWGSTKLLPLRGRSRYMSPHHGTTGSSSRHHTALLRRLCGVTRILPLRGCSRYKSPHHGTTLRSFVACAGLPGSCPFGAARGISLLITAPHCAPSSLVRGYQNFAPSGLLEVILHSPFSILHSPFSILRSRLFPHFALVRGDIGEDLPLREEQDGGEHRAHHVGDGAGGPDACESVQSGIGEQHRHDVG